MGNSSIGYCCLCHRHVGLREFDRDWIWEIHIPGLEVLKRGDCNVCRSIKKWRKRSARYRRKTGEIQTLFWGRDLFDLWHAQGGRCSYCKVLLINEQDTEIDHVQPKSKGGLNEPENYAISCHFCNQSKHARAVEDWQPPSDPRYSDLEVIRNYKAKILKRALEESYPGNRRETFRQLDYDLADAKRRAGLL